ncbi:MAG TPA: 1,2-phenylacetyl-CoA epoxidase subunit PaaD [Steroidobacteraceae bacterium]|nr:1,2-phenylacetyl-CoA epoxidase subunit PaaD [Steroidobacteraceae bacterium]
MSATAATGTLPAEVEARIRRLLAQVPDPEIPVLSVLDLGVIRHLGLRPDGTLEVGVAPTYSGCPATPVIKADIMRALTGAGFRAAAVDVLSPPWTSDWISAEGRRRLQEFGIAPPAAAVGSTRALLHADPDVACPRCGSRQTARTSEFGSTPCKALYRCESCLEPFDYFKCI